MACELGGGYKEGATYLTLLADDTPLVAGGSGESPDYADQLPYLAKLDTADGSVIWEMTYGTAAYSTLFFAAKECPNTDLIACGVTYEGGWEQGLLLRATSTGDSLWFRRYASYDAQLDSCEGRFWDVLPTNDGGFIASGFANLPYEFPFPPGVSQDAWVVKVDSMGCIVPGCQLLDGITESVTNLSDALLLYPNPVQDQLHVALHLPPNLKVEGPLTLTVTSPEGKIAHQQQVPTSGAGEVLLDVNGLAPGVYGIHLSDAKRWLGGKQFVVL